MSQVKAKRSPEQVEPAVPVLSIESGSGIILSSDRMPPDVPDNHWALESISHLAKSQLVAVWKDGLLRGNQVVTNREAAEMIDRLASAMQLKPASTGKRSNNPLTRYEFVARLASIVAQHWFDEWNSDSALIHDSPFPDVPSPADFQFKSETGLTPAIIVTTLRVL